MAREMKDSGIKWADAIPEEIKVSRLGLHYDITLGKMLCSTQVDDTYTLEPYYCAADVHFDGISDSERKMMWFSPAEKELYLVKKCDLLVVEGGAGAGGCAIVTDGETPTYIQNSIMIVRAKYSGDCRYVRYWLEYLVRQGYIDVVCNKATIPHFTKDKLAAVPYFVFSEQERNKIADYLDEQCKEIDAILAKTRTSIEEYKKLKQAIITQAVTKGVWGNRPMKESGIEWADVIPEEIKISRLGLHYDIILGKMLCSAQVDDSYTLEPYYCAADVHFEGISDSERKMMWFSPAEKELYLVQRNDLLVVEGGAGAGGCAVVTDEETPTYIQNSIMIVRAKHSGDCRYVRYWLECLVRQGYIDVVCNKATIPHFTKDKLAAVPYFVFSEQERNEIADYLDEQCRNINSQVEKEECLLHELESYKKSLIYEYVTGKKEAL